MSNLVIPDFKTHTNDLVRLKGVHPLFPLLAEEIDGMPVIPAVASSTEQDLHEDTMAITALQDMCDVPVGTSVWLNHDYTLPGSYFGRSVTTPVIVQQNGIADLHTAYAVYTKEDGAKRTLTQIDDGAHHGVSGGFIITEYGFEGDMDDWFAPIIIHHVKKLEDSIVGIPANQRSWVENAIKGLFERCVRDDNGDEALRLAPAYKGMFTHDFRELTKSLTSQGLRKDLEAKPTRPGTKNRMLWVPLKKHFILQNGSREQALTREEAPAMLKLAQEQTAKLVNRQGTNVKTQKELEEAAALLAASTPETKETEETPEEAADVVEPVATETDPPQPVTMPSNEELQRQWKQKQFDDLCVELGYSPNPAEIDLGMLQKALQHIITTKAGKEFSTENAAYIGAIHAAVCSMAGTTHCEVAMAIAQPNENDGDETDDGNDDNPKAVTGLTMKSVPLQVGEILGPDFSLLVKTLNDFGSTIIAAFGKINIAGMQTTMDGLQQAALNVQQQFVQAQAQINAINADVAKLKGMPLGNPTLVQRTVEPNADIPVATYADLLSVNQVGNIVETLADALAKTSVKPFKMLNGSTIPVRHWPDGVGKDVRPALTMQQKMFMPMGQQHLYASGAKCLVPCFDEDAVGAGSER